MTTQLPEHPAKYSPEILSRMEVFVRRELQCSKSRPLMILDPFAGTGRIHELMDRVEGVETVGIEIEPEWAAYHQRTRVGNALELPDHWTSHFDMVVTSPTYGNRMADSHNAKDSSKRITYKHKLGRDPSPDSSGTLHFGLKYQQFHRFAWAEVARVTKQPHDGQRGGLFLCNVSDFIRHGERVDVTNWHIEAICAAGFEYEAEYRVDTKRMGFGSNSKARVAYEVILKFRRKL